MAGPNRATHRANDRERLVRRWHSLSVRQRCHRHRANTAAPASKLARASVCPERGKPQIANNWSRPRDRPRHSGWSWLMVRWTSQLSGNALTSLTPNRDRSTSQTRSRIRDRSSHRRIASPPLSGSITTLMRAISSRSGASRSSFQVPAPGSPRAGIS